MRTPTTQSRFEMFGNRDFDPTISLRVTTKRNDTPWGESGVNDFVADQQKDVQMISSS